MAQRCVTIANPRLHRLRREFGHSQKWPSLLCIKSLKIKLNQSKVNSFSFWHRDAYPLFSAHQVSHMDSMGISVPTPQTGISLPMAATPRFIRSVPEAPETLKPGGRWLVMVGAVMVMSWSHIWFIKFSKWYDISVERNFYDMITQNDITQYDIRS